MDTTKEPNSPAREKVDVRNIYPDLKSLCLYLEQLKYYIATAI